MSKYYAKQINPEFQEDDLFYDYKDKRTGKRVLGINDEFYAENVIICGNRDFMSYEPDNLESLQKHIEYFNSDLQGYYGEQGNLTELSNYYFKKYNGKRWSKKELHQWRKVSDLTENYSKDNEKEAFKLALKLITGKEWKITTLLGNSQRDYQYMWYSEELTDKDIDYIECCYFNNGTEWLVYECYKDFKNDKDCYSIYVNGWRKEDIAERIGCKEKDLVAYEFTGYSHTPEYKIM